MNDTLTHLTQVIASRQLANGGDPKTSYVSSLFAKGDDAILKKVGEEAAETIMAAKDVSHGADKSKLVYECADLWFHTLVMLAQYNLTAEDVLNELARREGLSGLVEKANRSK